MALYRYKTHGLHGRKSRNTMYFLIAVVVIIVGIIILRNLRNKGEGADVAVKEETGVKTIEEIISQPLVESKDVFEEEEPAPAVVEVPEAEPVAEVIEVPAAVPVPVVSSKNDSDVTSPQAALLIAEAKKDIASGRIIAAREKLNEILLMRSELKVTPVDIADIKTELSLLSQKWLFSRNHYPQDNLTGTYKVQPGNTLENIGKKFNVPYEILATINNITRPERLRASKTIKIINGPFNAIIHRPSYTMDLYLRNMYVKSYRIGLGIEGRETPTGKWRVRRGDKLIKPPWTDYETQKVYQPDDEDYPLGSRWIGLEGMDGNAKGRTGFALHGTKDTESIGVRSSRGCIRLYNGDVIEVYNLLVPVLSEVRIVD